MGERFFVWFKDSTDGAYYEASADITEFLEKGDLALEVALNELGGADATVISQALQVSKFEREILPGISVTRLRDESGNVRLKIVFPESLSAVVSPPLISLLGRDSGISHEAVSVSVSEDRLLAVAAFKASEIGVETSFGTNSRKVSFCATIRRQWTSTELPIEVCVDDFDCDGVEDTEDDFPSDPSEAFDSDADGVGDNTDDFPFDPMETFDSDKDGLGDNSDPDNDNDGVVNEDDAFPFDHEEVRDSDGDGVGNNADDDDDGDGIIDESDAFPLDPEEAIDSDGDGLGNNSDPDDDNDGVTDEDEIARGSDPQGRY